MKFLCDRCNTRYSIGDDRVRGKILKIRCKSCSHVITVREGMPSPDAEVGPPPGAEGMPRRVQKTTTMAPVIQSEAPAPPAGAPAAATAGGKPPAALDDEWYVSIDGEQAGPFSLGDAQRWVAGHAADADLHCWNEGFDDWLPVDKVSHFRGLRKKPAPAPAAAPMAAVASRASRASVPAVAAASRASAPAVPARPSRPPSEDEPKPLFAATMAQLEKDSGLSELRGRGGAGGEAPAAAPAVGAPAPAAAAGLGAAVSPVPSPLRGLGAPAAGRPLELRGPGGARPAATPPNGNGAPPAHANGAAIQAKAAASAVPAPVPVADRPSRSGPIYAATQPGVGLKQQPPANPFDASENDSATQLEAPAFDPGAPAAARKDLFDDLRLGRSAAAAAASALAAVEPAAAPASASAPAPTPALGGGVAAGDDDDLDIGEVSRVVKLADLAKSAGAPARAQPVAAARPAASALNRTGAVPRLGAPKLGDAAPGLLGDGDPMALVGAAAEPVPPAAASRRGMIALLVGALLLVGVAVAVVVFFVLADDEVEDRGLARVDDVDTTRPDEVRRGGVSGSGGSAAGAPVDPPPNPFDPKPRRPVTPPVTPPPVTPPPDGSGGGTKLDAREIEEMAAKNSSTTQRCYMRAQRGVDGILTADVKKIAVTLTVGGDGTVTAVQLSDKQEENSLGRCLITAIKGWRFRASPGGTFRISLHFG